ncbi:Transposase DDE domain protein [Holospora curviuscula]|uniref:Transposase DDE domain protein n=1 Tax=Holospora curviuscula TaxID=1082868 RepID=A0A2S5R701_9PROT|nr:Transposase DDE domain protein [Holospora curviuscula]
MPVRIFVTEDSTADCTQAEAFIEGINAQCLLADKGYDADAVLDMANGQTIQAVIPAKRNRKEQCFYDQDLYKIRHRVENAFLHLKRWRGIATRYAKNSSSFLAAAQIRSLALWLLILLTLIPLRNNGLTLHR